MTTCTRRTRRETAALVRDAGKVRPIILTIEMGGQVVKARLKGTRREYAVPVGAIWRLGVDMAVAQRKAERAAKKNETVRANRR